MLAPALTFLLHQMWARETDHARYWTAIARLLPDEDADPVARSVASRVSAELPSKLHDLGQLAQMVQAGDEGAARCVFHIVGALSVRLEDGQDVGLDPWFEFAQALAISPRAVAWPLRALCFLLADRVICNSQFEKLGFAARALLEFGMNTPTAEGVVAAAVGFVAQTYGSAPVRSRQLLMALFSDDNFDKYVAQEIPTLARNIEAVSSEDPDFAAEIYAQIYARSVLADRETRLNDSQILGLKSNARQDFSMARYSLSEHFADFLRAHPRYGATALVWAVEGYIAREHASSDPQRDQTIKVDGQTVRLLNDYSSIWGAPDAEFKDDAETLVAHFTAFLTEASESDALEAAGYIVQAGRPAILWARLFMVAATRGGALASLLWPIAAQDAFLHGLDTSKDALDLVARHYGAQPLSSRERLERTVLDHDFSRYNDPDAARSRQHSLIFGQIGADNLVTQEAREVAQRVLSKPVTNERNFSGGARSYEVDAFELLEGEGLDPEAPTTQSLKGTIEDLKSAAALEEYSEAEVDYAGLPAHLVALRDAIVREPDAHEGLRLYAEGLLGQAVRKCVENGAFDDEITGLLIELIEFTAGSKGPIAQADTEAEFEKFQSWSSPAARVEAAGACLDLCWKQPHAYVRLAPVIDQFLRDPHPAVRLQAATRLVRLWDVDRAGLWALVTRVCQTESNLGVLSYFIGAALSRLVHHDTDVVEALVYDLLDRDLQIWENHGRGAVSKRVSGLITVLWVTHERPQAFDRLKQWIGSPADYSEVLSNVIATLRSAFVLGLTGKGDVLIRKRAQEIAYLCTRSASQSLSAYFDIEDKSEADREHASKVAGLLDTVCRELYFASGATRSSTQAADDTPALTSAALKTFFDEIEPTLRTIGDNGQPHTIYYLLQLLEYVMPISPERVFDLAAHAVLNGGRRSGYQFESLGADLLVRLTGQFLADHKEIFKNEERRQALIECLELFLSAGWPSARRLLYRLPELIQ